MRYCNKLKKYSALFASMLLISACQTDSSTPTNIKFTPPQRIMQVRAIDLTQVRPIVKLGDGTLITMRQGADNSWTGSIRVEPNQIYQISVDWIETLPQDDLILAQWISNVAVEADGKEVSLGTADYDYSADYDGDGIENLKEREAGTNPFDPTNSTELAETDSTTDGTGATDGTGTTDGTSDAGDTDGTTSGTTSGTTTGDGATDATVTTAGDTTTDTGTNSDTGTTGGTATTAGTGGTTAGSTAGDNGNLDSGGSTTGTDTTGDTSTTGDTNTTGGTGTTEGTTGGTDTGTTGGTVHTKASVLIPRIATSAAPAINGEDIEVDSSGSLTGEWAGAVEVDDAGSTLWINNLMIDAGADGENGAELRRWAAMHDGEKLYILVLSDDIGFTNRHSDSEQPWNDDSIEIFIDGDNSKLTEYGDEDDFHIILPLQRLNSTQSNNEIVGRSEFGPMSSRAELDYEFSTGIGIGPDGIRQPIYELDVYEVAIPLDDANITLGFPVGLEIQLNDDDDGDVRDSKWGWFHLPFTETDIPDESYTNPSIMGTVILEE